MARKRSAAYKKRLRVAAKRKQQKQREFERQLIHDLILKLTTYMELHYGNPVTGREGTILDGPVIARLSAAASLRALLVPAAKRRNVGKKES